MFNKILILGGILLGTVLIIESSVSGLQAYVFLSTNSTTTILTIVSILVGVGIGFGIKGMIISGDKKTDDELDF